MPVEINVDEGVIMQKINFYAGMAVIGSAFLPQSLSAQCVSPIQDCYALGYTQTSCPNGKGVKCPFGSGWYCGGTAAQDCLKLGYDKDCTGAGESGSGETCNGKYQSCTCDSSYQYSCTGTGYAGGAGSACGGKYIACSCVDGYEWKDGVCVSSRPMCEIGFLYYSDNTCSNNLESGKNLLGVVIYYNGSSGGGWIMTVNPIQTGIAWSTETVDIPELTNIASASNLIDIQSSCINTDIIIAYGNSSKYPVAWIANNYHPTGTPSGKKWCLPSGGLLNNIVNNYVNFAKINLGITTAGGTILGYGGQPSYYYEYIWSSSEYSNANVWYFDVLGSGAFVMNYCNKSSNGGYRSVRPVMEF